MKKYFFMAVTAIAALSSCSNDNDSSCSNDNEFEPSQIGKQALVFTATMEGAPETRATYDGTYKCASWEVDDRISINGVLYQAQTAGTSTTFSESVVMEEMRPVYISSTNTGSYENQPAANLVDDRGVETRWIADKNQRVAGAWNIVVSTGQPVYLKSIKLWNYDNASYPNRRWKTMRLYGSTTTQDDEWEEISDPAPLTSSHPFNNLNLAINNRELAGEIAVNSTKAYTFYRIDVLDNEGDNYMQMSDMKFVVAESETLESPYTAYFPADLYQQEHVVLPANITETWADGKFNMPMYAHSESTNLQFKNLCGVLKVIVKNDRLSEVKGIRVSSANKATSGAFTVNSDNAAVLTNPTNPANTVTVTYTEAVPTTAEGTVFYVAIPAQTYRGLKIELSADGENFTKTITTKEDADIVVERNKIYPINHVKTIPSGALPFEFTVNAQGKKVYFSKGNLQATFLGGDPTNYSWGFAQHQYDIIGNAAGNTTIGNQTEGAVVDLFGWSTPSTYYGISTSKNDDDYSGDFKDWGTAIDNNGTWRTLSKDEWSYLCKTRAASTVNGTDSLRYAYTVIFGFDTDPSYIQGIILFPDDYTHPSDVYPDFEDIILDDWLKMEAAGCVFLPREGYRRGSDLIDNGAKYWSSSKDKENSASYLKFSELGLECTWDFRRYGYSVRLVTDVK